MLPRLLAALCRAAPVAVALALILAALAVAGAADTYQLPPDLWP